MKVIRQWVCFHAIATGLGVLASVFIFFEDVVMRQLYRSPFLVVAILATVFFLGSQIRANIKLKTARLILENQILHIQLAKIDAGTSSEPSAALNIGCMEVFISCFGILLGSKVIKFNLDGIHLKAVEIGHDFIYLTYGTDKQTRKTWILHGAISSLELQSIVERFRYETGVVPVITDL